MEHMPCKDCPMIKRLLVPVVPFVLLTGLVLTGCSGTGSVDGQGSSSSEQTNEQVEEVPAAPDLSGVWVYTSPNSESDTMKASVAGEVITVEWGLQSVGFTGIYWVGTFEAPTSADVPYTWTSQRDAAATDSELLAATSDTKDFTYNGDTISFELSIQGESTTVEMKRS